MKLVDLEKNLPHKKRTLKDLSNYIMIKSGVSPNYSLFLGAGASVTSGINSGVQLVKSWRKDIYNLLSKNPYTDEKSAKEYLIEKESSWYDPSNEYSSLFEKIFDLPAQRRRFVEHQVDGKLPSIGYSYLVELFQAGFFDTVFTTNFDDLINEAFYQFSKERPTLCAHDSSIKGLSVNSSRPKIVKLHGDYLFDSIKSTLNETESLESNTKDKLIEFTKKYGLIFIGYAGNDKSVMDVINHLLRQDEYLRNGIYWCFRKNDEINPELQKILQKDRVYYLEIEGFDQALSEIYSYYNPEGLSLESNLKSSKRELMFENFISDNYQLAENQFIKKDIDSLKKHTNKLDISHLINELSDGNFLDDGVTEIEFRDLLSLDNLIKNKNLDEAEKLAEKQISYCNNETLKRSYISRLISIFYEKEQYSRALLQMDKLIETDEFNINLHLKKSSLFKELSDTFDYLCELIKKFEYSYLIKNEYIKVSLELLESKDMRHKIVLKKLSAEVEKSIKLHPSLNNPAWLLSETIALKIKESNKDHKKYVEYMDDKIKKMLDTNPSHINTLRVKCEFILAQNNLDKKLELINELNEIYKTSSENKREDIIKLLTLLHYHLIEKENKEKIAKNINDFIEKYIKDDTDKKNTGLLLFKASYILSYECDLFKAKELATYAIENNDANEYTNKILEILLHGDIDINICNRLMETLKGKISEKLFNFSFSQILTENEKYDDAIIYLDKALSNGLHFNTYLTHLTFIYLKEKNYQKVINTVDLHLKELENDSHKNVLIINRELAVRKLGNKINQTDIRNAIGSDHKTGVSICGHILLGDNVQAKRLLDEKINNDFSNYYVYLKWPAIPDELLEKYKIMIKNSNVIDIKKIA